MQRGLASLKCHFDHTQLVKTSGFSPYIKLSATELRCDQNQNDTWDDHLLRERFTKTSSRTSSFLAMTERYPLAEKAMSEGYARLRFRDTSLLIWQQQQLDLEKAPPTNYLSRSQSSWYSQYGNQAVVVQDKTRLKDSGSTGQSRICAVMWWCYSCCDYNTHIWVFLSSQKYCNLSTCHYSDNLVGKTTPCFMNKASVFYHF